MKNSKLIKVLKTLNKSEFKQFGKMVYSPFFSSGRNVIPLFESLKKFYPNFDDEGFNGDNLLKELSRNGYKASNQQLKTQMSEMYNLAEQFLTIQNAKKETGLNTYYLAKNLRNRGHYKIGESNISHAVKKIKSGGIDGNFYHNYYYGNVELINFSFMRDKPLKGVQMLSHLSEVFLHEFLCNVSRYFYNMIVLRRSLNISSEQNLLFNFLNTINFEEMLLTLENRNDIFSKASHVYLLFILMFLKFGHKEYYFRLKNELFANISIFSVYDRTLFLQAANFWADEMIKGINYDEFARETFELINFRLKHNLYKQAAGAPYTLNEFHTAFGIGFILREKQWLQDFLGKYLDEVSAEHQADCRDIADVYIDFLECDYIKCLKGINRLKNLTVPLIFGIKRLQLMALYEAGHTVQAFYTIDAFKSFLKHNKQVSSEFLKRNSNFIKFYSMLLKHKYGEEEQNLKKILSEAKNSEVENQEWVTEKAAELS